MLTISKKEIENYYEKEWSDFISETTIHYLIDTTCKKYKLNQQQVLDFVRKDGPKPQDLGQI